MNDSRGKQDQLARLLSALGVLIFAVGWAGIVFLVVNPGGGQLTIFQAYGGSSQGRVFIALQHGTSVTIAAALLWGVATLLRSRSTID